MAKCPYCGNDVFAAHQICHLDVLVGPDGKFLENDSADGSAEFEDLNTMEVNSEPTEPDYKPFVLISENGGTKVYEASELPYHVHVSYQGEALVSLYAEPTKDELIPIVSGEQGGKLALHLMTASKQYAEVDKMIRNPDPEMRKVARILCASTRAMGESQSFFLDKD